MKTFNRFSAFPKIANLATFVALASLASACGGQAYREAQPVDPNPNPGPEDTYNWGGGGGSNTGGSGSTTPTDPNALPAYSVDFTLRGRGGISTDTNNTGYIDTSVAPYVFTTSSVETDNLLKVKVTALPGSPITSSTGGSNFTANYGCVKYTVKVNNTVRQTQFLRVGTMPNAMCPNAPESEVLDFSSILAAGHHTLSVSVTEARYDFYCQMFQPQIINCGTNPYTYYNSYCNFQPSTWWMNNYCTNGYGTWKTHNVNGRLQVQVNGTTL